MISNAGTVSRTYDSRKEEIYRKRAFIQAAKDRPCMDCGGWFGSYQMEFDHRPGTGKRFNLSQAGKRGWRAVSAELAKCDAVCRNCHAEREHKRRPRMHYGWKAGATELTLLKLADPRG